MLLLLLCTYMLFVEKKLKLGVGRILLREFCNKDTFGLLKLLSIDTLMKIQKVEILQEKYQLMYIVYELLNYREISILISLNYTMGTSYKFSLKSMQIVKLDPAKFFLKVDIVK